MQHHDSYIISSIELTNTCTGKCIMCPRSHAMTREQGFMDFALFKSVIAQYRADTPSAANVPLRLDGMGESLLHPQYDRFIAYAVRKGFKPTLAVNPAALTEEASRRLLNAGLCAVDLALEGASASPFARIRDDGAISFEHSLKNILSFLGLKRSMRSDVQVSVSFMDFPGLEEHLDKAERLWAATEGVDAVVRKPLDTRPGDMPIVSALIEPSFTAPCTAPFESVAVLWDGKIVPCRHDYNARHVLGNACDTALCDIWNGGAMQRLRAEFQTEKIVNALCTPCKSGGAYFRHVRFGNVLYPERILHDGKQIPLFFHNYNCGWRNTRTSERSLEMAIAFDWLDSLPSQPVEIGAVTPYYAPGRVPEVIDPADPHPLVTHRESLFSVDFKDKDVLSISTIEHVGTGEYGNSREENAVEALETILAHSRSCLVTFPLGYNKALDDHVATRHFEAPIRLSIFVRSKKYNNWKSADTSAIPRITYGPATANGVVIIEKKPYSLRNA